MEQKRPAPLNDADAQAAIQRLLGVHGGFRLTAHIRQRMRDRAFDVDDALRVLRCGCVTKTEWSAEHQNWVYTASYRDYEGDPLSIVVAIEPDMLILVTGHD